MMRAPTVRGFQRTPSAGIFNRGRFSPLRLPNLAAWYDLGPTRQASTTSDDIRIDASNRVSLIADRSGNSGTNCLCLNGVSGNWASAPDAAPLDITGDLDLRVFVRLPTWTPATDSVVISKWTTVANQRSYWLSVNTTGALKFNQSTDGSATATFNSTVATGFSAFAARWVRATLDVDNGAAGRTVTFYTSEDGVSWTQLGSPVTVATAANTHNSSTPVAIGASEGGTGTLLTGIIYRAQIYNGINGTLAFDANFALAGKLVSSFTESSSNAATVTINSSGDLGARISGERDLVQLTASKQPVYLPWSGTNYGWLGGITNNRFNTPFTFAAGQRAYDIAARVSVPAFSTAIGIVGADNTFLAFGITSSNFPYLRIVQDGTGTDIGVTSATAITSVVSVNQNFWLRVVYSQLTGTGSFQYSLDDTNDFSSVSWTTLAAISGGNTVNNGFAITTLAVGSRNQVGTSEVFAGRIFRTRVVVNSTTVDFDPSRYQSGTTFTASTGETWTLNGGATIVTATSLYFDGTDDYMKAAAFSLSQPETVYFVGQQVSWTNNDRAYDGNAADSMTLNQTTASSGVSPQVGIFANAQTGLLNTWTLGLNAIMSAVFNGASSSLRLNRTTASAGNAGTASGNGFTLGAGGSGAGTNGNIRTNEVAIYAAAHDTATQDRFALYAGSKWRFSV